METKNPKKAQTLLSNTLGIHSTALATRYEAKTPEEISKAAIKYFKPLIKPKTQFAVRATRSELKGFKSKDIEINVGAALVEAIPSLKVNLSKPKFTAFIEARRTGTYCYVEDKPGLGGLPLGVEGSVGFVFEGKKNEPLAAFLLMRRGCHIYPIIKTPGAKTNSNISKLVKFNSNLKFIKTPIKNLKEAIKENKLLALGNTESKIGSKALNEESSLPLPVLHPLLLYPKELAKQKKEIIGVQ